MNPEKEPGPKKKSFKEIEEEMADRGFTFVGQESLTNFEFTRDARFLARPYRTKKDIAKEFIERHEDLTDIEVELVDVPDLSENQEAVYVFIKSK